MNSYKFKAISLGVLWLLGIFIFPVGLVILDEGLLLYCLGGIMMVALFAMVPFIEYLKGFRTKVAWERAFGQWSRATWMRQYQFDQTMIKLMDGWAAEFRAKPNVSLQNDPRLLGIYHEMIALFNLARQAGIEPHKIRERYKKVLPVPK